MEARELLAGTVGRVERGGRAVVLSVVPLGDLHVRSGRLGAADPFLELDDPLVVHVPAGTHPVTVTVADVSEALDGSHLREAYLSVNVAAGEVARVEVVVPEGAAPPPPGTVHGVSVDSGTVAFVDADAVAAGMPPDGSTWYETVFDPADRQGWFAITDDPVHYRAGSANVVLPRATDGENVVLTHSGWGDGLFRLLTSHDAEGRLLGVHIDLDVVPRDPRPETAAPPTPPTPPPAQPQPRQERRWFDRFLGRS